MMMTTTVPADDAAQLRSHPLWPVLVARYRVCAHAEPSDDDVRAARLEDDIGGADGAVAAASGVDAMLRRTAAALRRSASDALALRESVDKTLERIEAAIGDKALVSGPASDALQRQKSAVRSTLRKSAAFADVAFITAAAATDAEQAVPATNSDALVAWVREHLDDPRPSKEEKEQLMVESGMSYEQVMSWFINARRRLVPRLLRERDGAKQKPQKKKTKAKAKTEAKPKPPAGGQSPMNQTHQKQTPTRPAAAKGTAAARKAKTKTARRHR